MDHASSSNLRSAWSGHQSAAGSVKGLWHAASARPHLAFVAALLRRSEAGLRPGGRPPRRQEWLAQVWSPNHPSLCSRWTKAQEQMLL
uniref:Uncharacterized protein n=1 Tax=Setaria viridis TaxID=4556 RepID=A0A4U6VWZ6_SETVI|nr:hypothetical protein SEVIR_2G173950v2 [Setaria viridis]